MAAPSIIISPISMRFLTVLKKTTLNICAHTSHANPQPPLAWHACANSEGLKKARRSSASGLYFL
jgi:hypothetical protein